MPDARRFAPSLFPKSRILVPATDRRAPRAPPIPVINTQVLKAIHTAELSRRDGGRNVLKLLSVNTRRTKVVALSTGTHRVPDELRRHQLADEEGNEYSTNLDRNRYGNDDQYLFTVIKFNLEALGLCPLIAQVEIIDAKAAREECVLVVKVPDAGCTCDGGCVNGVRDGVHVAAREIVGGSAAQRESVARGNEQSARRARESGSGAKSGDARTPRDWGKTKEQWRVPTTPMSPMKRNASAGDVGGMGMLLDALTQVGGMPPPSPLHLRSPPHGANVAGRRASFLSGGANMAAASPSMRPAAAAMSALCASAPPSADRDAVSHMGGVGGVAQAAAAAAAAAQYYGFAAAGQSNAQAQLLAIQQQHEQQQLLFQSPPLMQKFAAAAAGLAPAPGASNGVNDFSIRRATPEALANESVLEELVERERGEAAAARAAEAKANARVAELERELQLAAKKDEEDATGDDGAAKAEAEKAEQTAEAVAREDFAHRLVALEEEIAAFGARAEAAARNAGAAGGDAMTALYVAEARAHARALVRVARLEAAAALAPLKDDLAETNAREETIAAERRKEEEADPEEGGTIEASTPAATAVENVASLAAVAEAEKRARDDDGFFEPPPAKRDGFFEPPPAKRPATDTNAVKKAAAKAAAAGAVGTGYAPPTTPALADAPNGRETGVPSPDQPAQALHFAAAGRA